MRSWIDPLLPVAPDGSVTVADPASSVLQGANSETGVVQDLPPGLACVDAAQAIGRIPFAFDWSGAQIKFTRNLPANLLEESQVIANLKDVVDLLPLEELFAKLSFIEDPQKSAKNAEISRVEVISQTVKT